MSALKYPLTNAQMELMKLFGTDLDERDLKYLKLLLSHFYAKKATQAADTLWDERGLSDMDMDKILSFTSYP